MTDTETREALAALADRLARSDARLAAIEARLDDMGGQVRKLAPKAAAMPIEFDTAKPGRPPTIAHRLARLAGRLTGRA